LLLIACGIGIVAVCIAFLIKKIAHENQIRHSRIFWRVENPCVYLLKWALL
jgi:hypothetical protein